VRIYVVRHAHAVPEAPALADEHRHLSARGREVARAVAQALRDRTVVLDAIYTSPLVRAVQTAELFAEVLGFAGEVRTLPGLAPGFPPRLVAERAAALGQAVALVGHEPGISALGAELLGRPSFPQLRPAQVCAIEDGRPLWTYNPDSMAFDQLLVA
jgi:phosphohistidine phosphatase